MKKLAIISLSLVAASAFATGYGHPEINIDAASVQVTSLANSAVTNTATGGGEARQNLASNAGNVYIGATSMQIVATQNTGIANSASGQYAAATQSLATNLGKVNVDGLQVQMVAASNSYIGNSAAGYSKAVQNVSTNNGCQACN
ncbi:hypothetical protein [Acidovorax sp. Leaf160]|uniref:hypothetical protein n=1 Tax=Acidovorax sp. Leaf160 TaxID=1736280 RepID=UPI000701AC5B|nr:hypothetical protein [Acidovorax sp. Leaf160]KQR55662.1 hypothetical protein ASF94_04505 [Acidovorax sp. Leaf160]